MEAAERQWGARGDDCKKLLRLEHKRRRAVLGTRGRCRLDGAAASASVADVPGRQEQAEQGPGGQALSSRGAPAGAPGHSADAQQPASRPPGCQGQWYNPQQVVMQQMAVAWSGGHIPRPLFPFLTGGDLEIWQVAALLSLLPPRTPRLTPSVPAHRICTTTPPDDTMLSAKTRTAFGQRAATRPRMVSMRATVGNWMPGSEIPEHLKSANLAGCVARAHRASLTRAGTSLLTRLPPPTPAACSNYGFDPLNLGKDPASLTRFQEAEVIHGRWAMLGVAGGCFRGALQAPHPQRLHATAAAGVLVASAA